MSMCHFAAQMDVRRSVADPVHDARVNIEGTLNLLEALRAAGATARVVFASTGGAIYGDLAAPPTAEQAPKDPQSPYGVAKLAVEHYLAYYARVHGLADDRAAILERVRPAPGPARRGRRGRDLLRAAPARRSAHGVRRRPADARLRVRGGRRARRATRRARAVAAGRRRGRPRVQHWNRSGDRRADTRHDPCRRGRGAAAPRRTRPSVPASSAAPRCGSTPPRARWTGARRSPLDDGLQQTFAWFAARRLAVVS